MSRANITNKSSGRKSFAADFNVRFQVSDMYLKLKQQVKRKDSQMMP